MSIPKLWTTYFNKFLRISIVFLIILGWIFSGWPQIWQNPQIPPKIQKTQAVTTITKTWSFDANTESWTASTPAPNNTTAQWQSADGSPANGSLEMRITGKNKADNARIWEIAGTWEAIFGIPAGSTVTEVGSGTGNSYNYRVSEYTTGAAGQSGPFAFYDNTPTLQGTFSAGAAFSGLVAWTAKTGAAIAVPSALQASSNTVRFRITNNLATGNSTSAAVTLRQDQIVLTITYTLPPSYTFLGNDTNPGVNPTIAPEAATTTVDTFNLKTSSGSDTVTGATLTFATGTGTSTVAVLITNSANTTTYCTVYNPTGDTIGLTGCNLPVTTASTTFNVRIKPLTHGAMPAPPGGTYNVTALITVFTSSAGNTTSGTDTTSDTVTIDNLSPGGTTGLTPTAGDAQVQLSWSNPSDTDFQQVYIYCKTSSLLSGEAPAEGTDPAADGTACDATARLKYKGAVSPQIITGLTNSTLYYFRVYARDTNGNFTAYSATQEVSATPQAVSLTFTIDTSNVSFVSTLTPGTPVSTSSVLTVNTNNSAGYNITINRASTTATLLIKDGSGWTISDAPNSNNWTAPSTATTTGAGPSAVWTSGTTKGLGFRIKKTGTVTNTYSTAWWGADDTSGNALYSGISTSTAPQMITKSVWAGSSSDEKTVVEYKLDVANTQKSGTYISSPITFTATAN